MASLLIDAHRCPDVRALLRDLNAEGVRRGRCGARFTSSRRFRRPRHRVEVATRLYDRGLLLPCSVGITPEERETVVTRCSADCREPRGAARRMRRYYTGYYRDTLGIADWSTLVALREDEEAARSPQFARLRDLLSPTKTAGPLLNVGCGTGGFDVVAASEGMPVVGVDADAEAISICAPSGASRGRAAPSSGASPRRCPSRRCLRRRLLLLRHRARGIRGADPERDRPRDPAGGLHLPAYAECVVLVRRPLQAPLGAVSARAGGATYLRLRGRPTEYLRTLRRLTPGQLTESSGATA